MAASNAASTGTAAAAASSASAGNPGADLIIQDVTNDMVRMLAIAFARV
jgi:hypothetical protein